MPTLEIQFKQAQEEANNLPERPDNDTLLELYALYKQGTKATSKVIRRTPSTSSAA
jgi:acyl-CoA-binding protein